jgi:hypothetical protein
LFFYLYFSIFEEKWQVAPFFFLRNRPIALWAYASCTSMFWGATWYLNVQNNNFAALKYVFYNLFWHFNLYQSFTIWPTPILCLQNIATCFFRVCKWLY